MQIGDISEAAILKMIARAFSARDPGVMVGIGDDAAVLALTADRRLVASCDMLAEGIHFDLRFITPFQLGWKALAVNLSDLAAMGAEPRYALLSLGLTEDTAVGFIEEFLQGLKALGELFQTSLCGGDTIRSSSGLIINITVLGEILPSEIITRSGAKPGDLIAVTGYPGRSAAGLAILQNNARGLLPPEVEAEMLRAHLEPFPRIREGRILALGKIASALNDISDGLAREVREIAEASGTGAVIHARQLPLDQALQCAGRILKQDPLFWSLGGGEDYELVFTFPPGNLEKLAKIRQPGSLPVTVIGEITDKKESLYIEYSDGRRVGLEGFGYDHFKL